MSDQFDVLKLVIERLHSAGIAYMVSGSMAMNYYAQPRLTRDIDIVVELIPSDVERVTRLFAQDFYIDEDAVRQAIVEPSLFNLIHNELVVKVDFIVRKDTPYRQKEFERRREVKVADVKIWLVTAEDLLLSKLAWAKDSRSEMQLNDVRNLITSVSDLDWRYIERWAAELNVSDLLHQVRV